MKSHTLSVVSSTMAQANPSQVAMGRPYRYRGIPDWQPGDARFREPGTARGNGLSEDHRNSTERKAARFAVFSEARDSGASVLEAGRTAGVALKTAQSYERERLGKQQREKGQ